MAQNHEEMIMWQKAKRLEAGVCEAVERYAASLDDDCGRRMREAAVLVPRYLEKAHRNITLEKKRETWDKVCKYIIRVESELWEAELEGYIPKEKTQELLDLEDELAMLIYRTYHHLRAVITSK